MADRIEAPHPYAVLLPLMSPADLDALAADIKANGQREAIWLTRDRRVIDGRNRLAACALAEVEPVFRTFEGDDAAILTLVRSLNVTRRHLSESQRAMAAARLATLPKGANQHASIEAPSQADAAEMFGVGRASVQRAREVLDHGVPELVESVDRDDLAVYAAAKLAALEPTQQRKALEAGAHVGRNSGDNEWYTPAPYIAAARDVMGEIDLDPASTAIANAAVGATAFFTSEQNGLSRPWRGRVWLNPPYAQPAIEHFAQKLADEYAAGHISQAVALVNNASETQWFQTLGRGVSALCQPAGRVRFWHPGKESATPLQGQNVLYLGAEAERFAERFSAFGLVGRRGE